MADKSMTMQPCPFCGSKNVTAMSASPADLAWAYCRKCMANGPTCSTQTEADWAWGEDNSEHPAIPAAIRAWNERAQSNTETSVEEQS